MERPLAHVVERLLGKVILTSDSTSEGGLTEPPGTGRLPRKQKFAPHLEGDGCVQASDTRAYMHMHTYTLYKLYTQHVHACSHKTHMELCMCVCVCVCVCMCVFI